MKVQQCACGHVLGKYKTIFQYGCNGSKDKFCPFCQPGSGEEMPETVGPVEDRSELGKDVRDRHCGQMSRVGDGKRGHPHRQGHASSSC